MLLLTRRINESVYLLDSNTQEVLAEVKIIAINGGLVRIGFECPTHVAIRRDNIKSMTPREKENHYDSD